MSESVRDRSELRRLEHFSDSTPCPAIADPASFSGSGAVSTHAFDSRRLHLCLREKPQATAPLIATPALRFAPCSRGRFPAPPLVSLEVSGVASNDRSRNSTASQSGAQSQCVYASTIDPAALSVICSTTSRRAPPRRQSVPSYRG